MKVTVNSLTTLPYFTCCIKEKIDTKKAGRKESDKADESTKDIGTWNTGKKVVKESQDHVKIKERGSSGESW